MAGCSCFSPLGSFSLFASPACALAAGFRNLDASFPALDAMVVVEVSMALDCVVLSSGVNSDVPSPFTENLPVSWRSRGLASRWCGSSALILGSTSVIGVTAGDQASSQEDGVVVAHHVGTPRMLVRVYVCMYRRDATLLPMYPAQHLRAFDPGHFRALLRRASAFSRFVVKPAEVSGAVGSLSIGRWPLCLEMPRFNRLVGSSLEPSRNGAPREQLRCAGRLWCCAVHRRQMS